MTRSRLLVCIAAAAVLVIIAVNCHKTPTGDAFEPLLLLNPIRVAVVQRGQQVVKVTALDEENLPRGFTVMNSSPGVVEVSNTDTTITITGLSCGSASVTVTCDTSSRVLPVRVYDPMLMETDELIISFVDTFEYRWATYGNPNPGFTDGKSYHPVVSNGFRPLGSLGDSGLGNPSGKRWAMVVKAKPGSNALVPPDSYRFVWNSQGGGYDSTGSFWNPVPPPGYRALGTVAQRGYSPPSLDDVVCVREDLTVRGDTCNPQGGAGGLFGAISSGSIWFVAMSVRPPIVGPHDSCYLQTGTFVGTVLYPGPPTWPANYLLRVQLPMLAQVSGQNFVPKLTGYEEPPQLTDPVMSREMLVPWTILTDSALGDVERLTSTPFYRLERQVYYKRLHHTYNQGSVLQEDYVELTCGVCSTESRTFWHSTGVSVTKDTGVSFLPSGMGGTLTVAGTTSEDFGYETQTQVQELYSETQHLTCYTAPGKASALWQKRTRFVLKRHEDTKLVPIASWEFGIKSYVVDDYPDE